MLLYAIITYLFHMYKIFKYSVPFKEIAKVILPKDAKIIRIDSDGGIKLWAIVNTSPNWPQEERTFYLFKTGGDMPNDILEYEYVGCGAIFIQMELMMYLFEKKNSAVIASEQPQINWKDFQDK